jgi:hypothetical protein
MGSSRTNCCYFRAINSWGIYGIEQYGIALFALTPFFMGFSSTILYGQTKGITYKQTRQIGFLTLGIFTAVFLQLKA